MYVARESGLHKLHPLTKGTLTLFLLVAGLALPGKWTAYFLLLFIIMPLAAWGRIFRNHIQTVWAISWPFALSVVLIQTLFWGEGTPIFELWGIAPKWEGAQFAFIGVGKIAFVMADFILFVKTTRPDSLMISLKQIGFPGSIAYVVVSTLQIIPNFQRKALTILDAQRSRGLETEGHILTRAQAVVPLVLPLVLGSLVDVEERAIAIEARAFNSNREESSLIEIEDSPGQTSLRKFLMLLLVFILLARIAWQLLN